MYQLGSAWTGNAHVMHTVFRFQNVSVPNLFEVEENVAANRFRGTLWSMSVAC